MRLLLVVLLAGSCLALSQLEQNVLDAIKQAQTIIIQESQNLKTIKEDGETSQTQKANGDSQMEQIRGDLFAEVTKLMVEKYGDDILPQLETVDMDALIAQLNGQTATRKKRYSNEPTSNTNGSCIVDSTDCTSQKNSQLRSITGVCNNRQTKNWGKAVTSIRRLLGKASYADGIGAIRNKSTTGSLLPSTRDISNRLHAEGATPVFDYMTNHLHMQFGQFIAHDVIFMPSSVGPNGETLDCSACNSTDMTTNCAPITVPKGDSYFPENTCIRLTRSLNGQKGLGQRTQIDQNTHFLDLSTVYGSDECVAANVRTFKNGELKDFNYNNQYPLPPQAPNDTNCQSKDPYFCFLAGDFRNTLHPGLIPLHTVYIKQHNMMAQAMRMIRPDWDDERTYQEARRLMIARHQHHVYSEYLPELLGQKTMDEFGLSPLASGFYDGYDSTVNPSLTGEFTAAAFRFGHSQVRKDIPRITNTNKTLAASVDLGANFFYADSLYQSSAGGTESMLDGMIQQPAMAVDKQFSFPIRNQLFEIRGKKASGVDLVAVNLMRGRDIGLFPYNQYRSKVGLPVAKTFNDLLNQMDPANVQALQSVYASVDDIDLYSGILMERPANGAMLGRTGAYIIAETFSNLKKGDRFFYESQVPGSRSLTLDELTAIRGTTLAKLMCQVSSSVAIINQNIFDLNSNRIACGKLTDIDVKPFVPLSDGSQPPRPPPPPGGSVPPPGGSPMPPPPPPPPPPPRRH